MTSNQSRLFQIFIRGIVTGIVLCFGQNCTKYFDKINEIANRARRRKTLRNLSKKNQNIFGLTFPQKIHGKNLENIGDVPLHFYPSHPQPKVINTNFCVVGGLLK